MYIYLHYIQYTMYTCIYQHMQGRLVERRRLRGGAGHAGRAHGLAYEVVRR